MKDLVLKILNNINIDPNTVAFRPYGVRKKILYSMLIEYILTDRLKELGLGHDSIQKKLRGIYPNKLTKESWIHYILGSIHMKKCSKCKKILCIDMFTNLLKNKDYICKMCKSIEKKKYYNKNAEELKRKQRLYRRKNKYKYAMHQRSREIRKVQAIPVWADIDKINLIYKLRPDDYHVDHIIPIKGKYVCGLHVENNLQYLLAKENIAKGNSYGDS